MTEPTYQTAATSGLTEDHVQHLETFTNQFQGRGFIHTITNPEWSSMCPKTGQPDYATIEVSYVADSQCIELKSFKMYCQSFRQVGIFYENIVNKILDDLVFVTHPVWMRVLVCMTPRGGISSNLMVEYPPKPAFPSETDNEIWRQWANVTGTPVK